ncbi:MAG: Blue-light-activated protein [candidate division BRC1 bacterium ADurb.BinA292]|nr:MAG: Blue-light-activated protein [candidate division BRC1 bacterium ADurb.BinA292]
MTRPSPNRSHSLEDVGVPPARAAADFRPEAYHQAAAAAGLGVWQWEPRTGRFRASPRCVELLGCSSRAGDDLAELLAPVHPEDRPALSRFIQEGPAEGDSDGFRLRIPRPGDAARWLEARCRRIPATGDGADRGHPLTVGTLLDVTAQVERDHELERLRGDLKERVKESRCLLEVSRLLIDAGGTIAECLAQLPELIRRGWQFPEICVVRIRVDQASFLSDGWRPPQFTQCAPIALEGEAIGELLVGYPERPPGSLRRIFLPEEDQLARALAERIGEFLHRRRFEDALRQSEERFRSTFEQAAVGLLHADMQGNFLRVNQRFCEIVGYDRDELLRLSFADLIPEGELQRGLAEAECITSGEVTTFAGERRYRRKNGQFFWANLTVSVVEDRINGQRYMICAMEDISQRKAQEQELLDTRFLMEKTLTSMHEAVLVIDAASGRILTCNPAVERLFGYPRLELIDQSVEALHLEPDNYRRLRDFLEGSPGQSESLHLECRMRCRDGRVIHTDHTVTRITEEGGWISGVVNVIRDISSRKQAEENLLRREQILEAMAYISERLLRAQQLHEALPSILSRLGETLEADRVQLFETTRNADGSRCTSLRQDWAAPGIPSDLLNPDLQQAPVAEHGFEDWSDRLDAGQVVLEHFTDADRGHPLAPDARSVLVIPVFAGSERWGALRLTSLTPRDWPAAEVDAARSVAVNIGSALQRRRIFADLRRLSMAIEQAIEAVVLIDINGRIQYVNRAFSKVTGYAPLEALGQDFFGLNLQEGSRDLPPDLWDTLLTGRVWDGRVKGRKKEGRPFDEEMSISPARDDDGRIVNFVVVLRDVTEQLRLDQQLRQSQKMEAIGQLAGGVAHDFNNLLQVIQGYSQLARRELAADARLREHLDQVLKASERAADLVSQLLTFSRRQVRQPRRVDLNVIVDDVVRMLRRVIGEHIHLEPHTAAVPCLVQADTGQLEQVLMNLCVNARDAMPHGGRLRVHCGQREFTPDDCLAEPWARPGQFAWLGVEDNGVGIPPDALEHIFEPFFTTKDKGRGTGLGLATVYGIVKQHDGLISVQSEPGRGTFFRVYLPLAQGDGLSEGAAEHEELQAGHGLILLAEDEELVRNLAVRILESAGYRVLVAHDGQQALDLLEQHADQIDLALLDMVMPRVSGRTVYEHIRRNRPSIPVLFTSGYSTDVLDSTMIPDENFHLIEKPYQPQLLLRRISELIRPGRR